MYLKSLYLELKALGQCGCEQWKGFSPVWLRPWRRSFSWEVNKAPQTRHSFPFALPTSSSSFPLSRSLSVRGSGAALPNSLAAARRPSSSGVSAVMWCEASAAAAAMAALERRCHEHALVAPRACRHNAGRSGRETDSSQETPAIQGKHPGDPKPEETQTLLKSET